MQNNISLEKYDSTIIATISNQVLTTIFTKDYTKVKLKNKFGAYSTVYKIEKNGDNELDSTCFSLSDNLLEVHRKENVNKSAKLVVYLLDGNNEIYINSWELYLLTKEQSNTYSLQEMRYNNNKTSYACGFVGILFSLIAAIVILNSAPYSWSSLIFILLTVAMVLVGFLASEKVKTYKINYSYVMFALAILCVVLVFWYPLSLIVNYQNLLEARNNLTIDPTNQHWLEVEANALKNLGIPIIGDGETQAMLPQSGTFRGITSIVLLLIAAVAYAYGAFNAYVKSNKLNKYLESINEKH